MFGFPVSVHFFFGTNWRAPLVLVVLAAFAGGVVVGVLGMLPGWWKHRSAAVANAPVADAPTALVATTVPAPLEPHATLTDVPAARQHGL